jgi:hypothetical protein
MGWSLSSSRRNDADRVSAGTPQCARPRPGAGRRMLAVLIGCAALFVVAPVAAAQATSLEGTVTAIKGGATLTGIEVTATSELGGTSGSATTVGGGTYTIAGLSTGEYKVTFHDPADKYVDQEKAIVLAAGTNMLSAALQEPGTISGRVTSAATGSGLGNVNISVEQFGGGEFFTHFTTTDPNGEYTITGLPPGQYSINFSSNEGGYISQDTTTTVTEGAVDTVNAALREGGKISGTVPSVRVGEVVLPPARMAHTR